MDEWPGLEIVALGRVSPVPSFRDSASFSTLCQVPGSPKFQVLFYLPSFLYFQLLKKLFYQKHIQCPAKDTCQKKKKLIFSTICTIGSEGGNHWCICECCEETFIQKEKYGSSVKINAIERKNGLTEILYIFHKEGERNNNWISVKYKYDEKWNHFVHEV